MKCALVSGLLLTMAFAAAETAVAQTATHLTGSEIDRDLGRTADQPEADQVLRVLSIGGQYNLGFSVVHRARTGGRPIGPAAQHSAITEIFHFIAGTGTVVTGGSLDSAQAPVQDPLSGPTVLGSRIIGGANRGVGPGDVMVIPPNTPVQFTAVNSAELIYLVVRVDPQKLLATTPPR
jgi:mannose-6-phosphate isomerase-like protein (cupin superfamily)